MSAEEWKGPTEKWDNHSRALARQALKRARAAGWYLKKSSGRAKVWGMITCGDPSLPVDQRCRTYVSSTSGPADGSETAKVINDIVNKCQHPRVPVAAAETDPQLDEAEALVDSAEAGLRAAGKMREAGAHRELMEDFLARAIEQADGAEDLLRSQEAQDAATAADGEAQETAERAGLSVSLGPKDLARRAQERAGEADESLRGVGGSAAKELRDRCDGVRRDAETLLREIEAEESGEGPGSDAEAGAGLGSSDG